MLEILYDGNLEAAGDVAAAARQNQAEMAKERSRLVFPAAFGFEFVAGKADGCPTLTTCDGQHVYILMGQWDRVEGP